MDMAELVRLDAGYLKPFPAQLPTRAPRSLIARERPTLTLAVIPLNRAVWLEPPTKGACRADLAPH